MTVPAQDTRVTYTASGSSDTFAYPFRILSSADLLVYIDDVLQVLTTDYTVTGADEEDGGNVVFVTPPVADSSVIIMRDMDYGRIVFDYQNAGSFRADTVNRDLDSLAMQIQQLAEKISRAPILSIATTLAGLSLPAPGASQYIRWNAAGTALEAVSSTVSAGTFLQSGTGTVERDANAKMAEIVSIDDFDGADPTGATSSIAAIQSALNQFDFVYVPTGTWQTTGDGAQAARNNQYIFGAGAGSILKKSDDDNAYVLYASSKSNLTICNLALDGSRATTADYTNSKFCLYLNDCDNCTVVNVYAYGAAADNIVVEYGTGNIVMSCHATDCNKDGIYFSGAENCAAIGNTCTGNGSNSTGGGVAVSATWGAAIIGNNCSGNEQFDILLSRGSRFVSVIGNTMGGFLTGQAPLSLYVLGEPMGGTLHGVNYGDGSLYYGASDCNIVGNTCFAEMRLELLSDSTVGFNTVNDSNDVGIWLYGCTRVNADFNKVSNYTNVGIQISASAKNSTTTSSYNHLRGNTLYKSGSTASTAITKSGTGNIYELNTLNSQPLESGGSWTPVISSDGTAPTLTYTDQLGTYAVIGDLVFVRARVTVNTLSSAGTGNIDIAGWPFQSLIKEQAFLTVSRLQQTQNAITAYGLGLSVSSSNAYFYYTPDTTGNASFLSSADGLKAGFSFIVSGCYRIGAA